MDLVEHIPVTIKEWIIFNVVIILLLAIDLFRFYRNPHIVSMKEAMWMSIGWITLAFIFNGWIYFQFGPLPALNFFTGYLIEESLSVDNLFVFLLIFAHFKVPDDSKHEVLFYGILGAIVMRALLIWGGIVLVKKFSWIFTVFGIFLIITGIRLMFKNEETKIEQGFFYRFLSRYIPLSPNYQGNAFIVKKDSQWFATPLLIVLILIEFTDLIFALDSVPAILGITTDPFIVYTSNIFAILGLRSLFFVLEGFMRRFYLLHYALAFILVFIGFKMLIIPWFHISTTIALGVIVLALSVAFIGSNLFPKKD